MRIRPVLRILLPLPLLTISRSNQCSVTGVTRPWYVLSCLWDGAYKITLAANQKE